MNRPALKVIPTAREMFDFSTECRAKGQRIGFVPTMGALHEGHMSLVKAARSMNDVVVVSVFVNPKQFNDASDLKHYPRTFEADRQLLEAEGADVMFFPNPEEVYPTESVSTYDMDGLDQRMEGPNRPGHFNGVVQVVTRLFDLVLPHAAYFGEKDFQQLAIVKHMAAKLGYGTRIIACPTEREPSGLAMSSRNVRLSQAGKAKAAGIHACLSLIRSQLQANVGMKDALENAMEMLLRSGGIELEYLELVDAELLAPATEATTTVQACIAVWIEGVRLIDNMHVK